MTLDVVRCTSEPYHIVVYAKNPICQKKKKNSKKTNKKTTQSKTIVPNMPRNTFKAISKSEMEKRFFFFSRSDEK